MHPVYGADHNVKVCSLLESLPILSACVPEQPDAETDHHVVERVKAHHAHQQVLQNNLQKKSAIA